MSSESNVGTNGLEAGVASLAKRIETDVLVVGGGTAGVTSALAAAANGTTRVLLAESSRGVGGVGTHSGIHAYYLGLHVGIQQEMDKRTRSIADELGSKAKGFHPEAKKIALQQLLAESGIDILYECVAVDVVKIGDRVVAVVFESPEGTVRIDARVTLDSTGNGDVCALAGVPYVEGREWDGVMNGYSIPPRYLKDGEIADFRNFDAGWVDSSSTRDVSRALLSGRKLLWDLPQLGQDDFLAISPHFGAREGRLVLGGYTLTLEDLILDQRFGDVVMRCFSHYDTHARDMVNESRLAQWWTEVMGAWSHRLGCDVPYRCFVPEGTDGLLIACRALSLDHDAAASFRMQPDIQAVGEVAGTAAAICCENGLMPRELDVGILQQRLIERGVLQATDLTRVSAPWVTPGGSKRQDRRWTAETVKREETIRELTDKLGTDEEGGALWWLWKAGDAAVPVLKEVYSKTTGHSRRGAAIALGLLGDRTGVPELIRSVAAEDEDGLPGFEPRIPPRWIACLVALKHLRETACSELVVEKVGTFVSSVRMPGFARTLHLLHYLIDVAPQLTDALREKAIAKTELLLTDPELGSDWGAGIQSSISARWNVDMTAGYLLGLLGRHDAARKIFAAYAEDERKYARNMARILSQRLSEAVEFNMNGMVKNG